MMKKNYCLIFLILSYYVYPHNKENSIYYEIKKNYEAYPENDSRAFTYLKQFLQLAKKNKNYEQLTQGYEDAVFFSKNKTDKLRYADSTILAAIKSKKNENISRAFLGKGIVLYFNFRKYKPALQEYLRAHHYSEMSDNKYLNSEIIYHIGVVKSYLGYYDSALSHFRIANQFFQENLKYNQHPNIIYNNKKGFLNTLHRIIVCERHLNKSNSLDSLISVGIRNTINNPDFRQEFGYFLKEKGILEYEHKDYASAIVNFKNSIRNISIVNDFSWTSVNYFYIGKSYLGLKDQKLAISNFKKVDSILSSNHFMLPELRENYELLIDNSKKNNDAAEELLYTKRLLKSDEIISKDFSYLSAKIHREYDTAELKKEKKRLEQTTSFGIWILLFLIVIAVIMLLMIIRRTRNERQIKINYKILEDKIINNHYNITSSIRSFECNYDDEKSELDQDLVNKILKKIELFEKKEKFTELGLTIQKMAMSLNTNSNYLSQIINEYKGCNFNRYLGELRIKYITNKLYNEKIFLSYKIETLAEKCGIASRSNFSNLFREINGMRPAEFIKKRLKDIEGESKHDTEKPIMSNQTSSNHLNLSESD